MDSCKQISHLISEGMDRRLHWSERVRIRIHLMMCSGCSNFEKQMRVIRSASRAFGDKMVKRDDG